MNTINVALIPELWVAKVQKEGKTASWFNKLSATDGSRPVHTNSELVGKKGLKVTFGLAMELTGVGVTGNTTLLGSEDALVVEDFSVTIDQVRQAVSSTEWDTRKPAYEQWPLIKDALVTWFANWQDKTLVAKLTANPTGNSTTGEWLSAAGAGTEVAIVAGDKLTCALISKTKRRGENHTPVVQQFKVEGNDDMYAMLISINAGRDLRLDPVWIAAQQSAGVRDQMKNPIFSGAMGIWDGVAIYTWKRISVTATGAAGALVAHNLLLGKQAACYAIGRNMWPIKQLTDYDNVIGQGIAFHGAIEKTIYDSKDYGVIQLLTSSALD